MAEEKICNLCGESCCPNHTGRTGTWKSDRPCGLIDAQVIGGYESYHLMDMSQYTFSLCEPCLRKLFVECKVKPKIHDVLFPHVMDENSNFIQGNEESWENDQGSYEYRVWEDAGGKHQAYLDRKCNRVKDCPNQALYTVYLSEHFTEDCVCELHKDKWDHTVNARLVKFIPNVLKPFL